VSKKTHTVCVTMSVTKAQAIALREMFDYWTYLGHIGASRMVGFFVDGDGDFQPECQFVSDPPLDNISDKVRQAAIKNERDGNYRNYDFDGVSCLLDD